MGEEILANVHLSIRVDEEEDQASNENEDLFHRIRTKIHPIPSSQCCIYRIPESLRILPEDAYVPKIISIGPLHRDKECVKAMEEHKKWYLHALLHRTSTPDKCLKDFLKAIQAMEVRIRARYAEPCGLSSDEFVEMILLDACFIIELFYNYGRVDLRDDNDPIYVTSWMLSSLKHDIILLENQLPLFVLQHLFDMIRDSDNGDLHLEEYVQYFFRDVLPPVEQGKQSSRRRTNHLLDVLRNHFFQFRGETEVGEYRYGDQFIQSATELSNAGMSFKADHFANSLLDITYNKNGVFEIPLFFFDDTVSYLLGNLIALEQCDNDYDSVVSSYIILLDGLISSPKDVKLLRREGILDSFLRDDEQKTSSVSKELLPLYNWTHCRTQMKMTEATMNPFDRLENSDVDYFKEVDLDVLQNSRDENNDTLFSKAAILDELECCREIYNRCPALIWRQNAFLNTALHHAIYYEASVELVSFLIDAALKRDLQGDPERGKKWLAVQNYKGDTALSYAVMRRNVEVTKVLMEVDYDHAVLRIANYKKQTPLHLAVQSQNLELVKLLTVPADFHYFPNKDGETPLLMAMRVALSGVSTAVEIRKFLLKAQPRECKVRIGTKGWTALHHASRDGDVDTIDDIIQFCPDCVQMVDTKGHNFLHVAVKFDRVDVVKHVLERKEISACVLNGQDHYGYTPLHAAVISGNRNMVLFLLYDPRVNKLSLNANGRRVIDMIQFDYDKKKAGVYGAMDVVYPNEMMEQSKFYLLVYAVIATISFTGITFPMVFNNEGTDNVVMPLLSKRASPIAFVLSNACALVLALCAGFSHIRARSLVRKKDTTLQLMVATMCIIGAVFAMVVAHMTGWCALWGILDGLAIIIFQMCCCFFVFALYPLLRMLKETWHSVALE